MPQNKPYNTCRSNITLYDIDPVLVARHIMMRSLLFILACVVSVTAFSPMRPANTVATTTHRRMFTNPNVEKSTPVPTALQEEVSPLQEVSAIDAAMEAEAVKETTSIRNLNTGEIHEVEFNDPLMSANTDPFNLGFGYIFLALPVFLLINDIFHFLPSGAPYTKY